MTSLRSHRPIINLKGESSIQLGIDLPGHTHPSEHVCYFDLEKDYKTLFQTTPDDCARMARAFLLYVLEAYLFTNGGQIVSLRWLALFCHFKQARGHACLAYFYSVMDMLSWGTLCQLVGPWKHLEVRFFSFSHVVLQILLCTLANCIYFIFLRCC